MLEDGIALLEDGSVLLEDGSVLLEDGSVLLEVAIALLKDDNAVLEDCSAVFKDCSAVLEDSSSAGGPKKILLKKANPTCSVQLFQILCQICKFFRQLLIFEHANQNNWGNITFVACK